MKILKILNTANHFNDLNDTNEVYRQRKNHFAQSRKVEVISRLHLGVFQSRKNASGQRSS